MENHQDLTFKDQKIVDIDMEHELKQSFIEYSMSVITSRALPDVRDGMKPGQRRILWAMYEDHLTHDKPFRKSATTVGNVLGRYHPHGDAAVYGTMVRMAQDFSLRCPLIEGHGNFGSVDGDGAAAYRYTEARLAKISDEMLRDIDKNVVPMTRNFDNRLEEPTVLPARFPNLLVNGSVGIAVGMATNIPPHNLGEVIDATLYRMDNPECTVTELMQYVKGPDFPTSAIIYGINGIKEAYTTGKGRIMVRARANVDEDKHRIIVTEIPYGVNKSLLCESIANLVKEKRIEGITELRDESGRNGMRIIIGFRRDANGQVILNQLYKYTQLQDTCAVNMLALLDGEPKILPLPKILDAYIAHQESVIINRTRFDLEKARQRAHIFEGYQIAINNIDEIVALMKSSPSIPESKARLMERYSLSDVQAQAIVDMTLGRLTGMEREKIEAELERLYALIAELEGILGDMGKIKQIIRDEMTEIRNRYSDERRTEIVEAADDIVLEDLIEKHDCVITITHSGYIKRQPADTYTAQRRGGKGIIGMSTKEEDFIERVLVMNSHSNLMMFTNTGKVHTRKAYMIPEAGRTAKGSNIVNILELAPGEKITAVIGIDGFEGGNEKYLTMVTRQGIIKRTLLSEYEYQRRGGKIAIGLNDGDELVSVMLTHGVSDIIIATADGSAVRFTERGARTMGRTARGVIGIRLREGDYVAGVVAVDDSKKLVTVTEKGYGKRTDFEDFRLMKSRGAYGVVCHNVSERTGRIAGIAAASDDDDLMMITDSGTIIRTPVKDIPVYSRSAAGVIVMRMSEGQSIVSCTTLQTEPEESEPTPSGEIEGAPAAEVIEVADAHLVSPEDMDEQSESEE
ncbi:MAG: DNA gyrase subunit A [Eubacteriales bacterium]|nr:DNA gyrase subunit A [Clostridiales bacterium]MDD7594237.1 DNA gyrase subunit A [Clostridiales bacterium]MDY5860902.1 DNA gyrase subunit A [Eubacteriales bacterium]